MQRKKSFQRKRQHKRMNEKSKILIVDDVKENVELLDQFFKSKGYQTLLAYGGREAIEIAEKMQPDLVLLDIMMPEVDGFRVCEVLKKERTHFKNVPIILVTARDDLESKIKGFSVGADDYVAKPFDIKELEARVRAALRLKKALDDLKELNELKNQFLGMASHDIKGPVTRIEQAIDYILKNKTKFTATQVDQLSKVKEEAHGVFNLISDLLNVVKIESGKVGLQKRGVDLSKLIEEVARMNEMMAKSKGIHVEFVIESSIEKVVADPDRLLEVLDNLLVNAIKFSKKGQSISLALRHAKGGVEFSVSDEGVGIPKEELSKVFQRFTKLSPQPTGNEKGTGLGLSICKEIIDLHQGKISVDSEPGKGTKFTVFLPS